MIVRDLFSGKEIDQEIFAMELKRQFDLESLFNQKLESLVVENYKSCNSLLSIKERRHLLDR